MKLRRNTIRRMGYIRDQEGIMNRYLREKTQWEQHLENTREFISSSFHQQSIESIAVLGSGWLLDVPLEDLVSRFKQIYLVDIFHPPQIRKKAEALQNVALVEEDLSGGAIHQLWELLQNRKKPSIEDIPGTISLTVPLSDLQADAFVSVNLLNQLDIILCDYLEKQGYSLSKTLDDFRSRLQAFHLKWITSAPGCLVSDTIEVSIDRAGNESSKSLLYADLPEGHRSNRWSWDFDSHDTYLPGSRIRMEVQAIEWT